MGDEDRFERRYRRERDARLQAEAIAERAIADLYAANRALDERVAARTSELEAALERARAADEVRAAFVRGLAHEMSTPLHVIAGLAELLADRSDETDVESVATEVRTAAGRLNHALRTLLEFAALSGGTIATEPEEVVLGDYLDGVMDRWRLAAARAGLLVLGQVVPDPKTTVTTDPARLDQILDALFDNAIRFASMQIEVDLTRDDAVLRLAVTDDGPGVAEHRRDAVFAAFARGEGANSDGFGIGLTLARAVAEALGGTLELNETTSGSRFVATLPLRGAAPATESVGSGD